VPNPSMGGGGGGGGGGERKRFRIINWNDVLEDEDLGEHRMNNARLADKT
jgi:hypothetical protein